MFSPWASGFYNRNKHGRFCLWVPSHGAQPNEFRERKKDKHGFGLSPCPDHWAVITFSTNMGLLSVQDWGPWWNCQVHSTSGQNGTSSEWSKNSSCTRSCLDMAKKMPSNGDIAKFKSGNCFSLLLDYPQNLSVISVCMSQTNRKITHAQSTEKVNQVYFFWFYQRFLPVKSEFFVPTVAKCLLNGVCLTVGVFFLILYGLTI